MFSSQLKTYCKNTLLAISCLSLLILLSVSAYANEVLIETETSQKQSDQQSKVLQEKQKYSFLSNQSYVNAPNQIAKKDPSTSGDALNVSLGLIVILVMIFSIAWFMKKMGYSNVTGQGQLKIIASLNLGQKEKIALIQVGKQQLLVGMTATQINTLHVLDEVLEETEIKQFGATGEGTFSSKFTELLKHKQSNVK